MAARRPFWKWRCWKSIDFCPWPPSTCIWNLKLKFQSKLDLCSGNHVVYRRTDGRADKVNPVYPPSNFVGWGYNNKILKNKSKHRDSNFLVVFSSNKAWRAIERDKWLMVDVFIHVNGWWCMCLFMCMTWCIWMFIDVNGGCRFMIVLLMWMIDGAYECFNVVNGWWEYMNVYWCEWLMVYKLCIVTHLDNKVYYFIPFFAVVVFL